MAVCIYHQRSCAVVYLICTVAVFSSSYNLMPASIMTVVLLLLLLLLLLFLFLSVIPPPNISGNSWNLILAAPVNYTLKTDDIHEI